MNAMQDIVKLLRDTRDPAEKAAIVAELVLKELPGVIASTVRKCVILHWFDQSIITTLLQDDHLTFDEIREVYEQIISLSFIEKLPLGFAIQPLTREGLLKRYVSTQPTLLQSAAHSAARGYEVYDNEMIAAEALFCYVIAGDQGASKKLLDRLTNQALERGDTHYIENLRGLFKEAEQFPFVDRPVAEKRQGEEQELLMQALAQISPIYRSCLILYVVEEMSQRQIAKRLHIKERAVSKYVSRAMEELRRHYSLLANETQKSTQTQSPDSSLSTLQQITKDGMRKLELVVDL